MNPQTDTMKHILLDDLAPRLDPELAAVFATMPRPPPDARAEIVDVRTRFEQLVTALRQALPPGAAVLQQDLEVPAQGEQPAVPLRVYRPTENATQGVLLWMHGGGFIAGDHRYEDLLALRWVRETGCTVVSVGYRLAPEHRHPAAVNDCYAALCWVAGETAPLGFKPSKLAIGGMSAGGCLAAATALMARDRGDPALCWQMLLIPVLDNRHQTPSSHEIADPRCWNRTSSFAAWTMYAGADFLQQTSPYLAPAQAQDLRGLPPCYIEVAEIDNLRDEAIEYGLRLMQAGVRTELHVYPGACHGSAVFLPQAAISERAQADATAALKAALA
ncbi:MAG: alpha/beta hydrolase [Pseudomonadota bacterium]